MNDGSARERLEAAALMVGARSGSNGPVIGVGWATVELERAVGQLATALGIAPTAFIHVTASTALGAHCLVAWSALSGGVAVVVLEPSTEGRLARRLARHDEGPAVVWQATPETTSRSEPRAADSPGPFGPERLVPPLPGRPDLIRFIVAAPPGTIQP